MSKKAILIGATGLIGGDLLNKLLASDLYSEVLVISRKQVDHHHPKLKQLTISFEDIYKYETQINGEDIFCCLGTTAKKTPNKDLFRKIDYQYPLDIAKIGFKNGSKNYHLISAMGADVKSGIFYNQVKGEIERDIKLINFKSLHIYQPSLLDGNRKESRFLEQMAIAVMHIINPILIGGLKKYRSIKIEKVASAILNQATKNLKGIFIYPSDQIEQLAS